MFHYNRVWNLAKLPREWTLEEVAEAVTSRTYTLCSAWQFGDILILNDSITEDSLQEYAIMQITDACDEFVEGLQLDSFTVSWMTPENFVAYFHEVLADPYKPHPVRAYYDDTPTHRCCLCA